MTVTRQQMVRTARRNADQARRVAAAAAVGGAVIATVTTVTAAGAADGNALVKVTRRGTETTAAGYLNSYTPTVNDRVVCVTVDDQPIVLGKVIGHP
ncbi:MAG: hypothetical protein ACXV3F_00355 [Frankiaceae bacterium]